MASKKLRMGSNAVLYSVVTIGILVLINIISSRKFTRVDLTQNKIYTISDASKKMVSTLPDRLTIKAFISSDLPTQIKSVARYLRDMLEEYATYSQGKVHWEVLDPSKDEKLKEEAQRLKVTRAQLSVFEKSKASVSESYLGVSFQYGGKLESIPFVQDISNLEYQISSTIKRLTSKKKKVGFTSGHGEPGLYQGVRHAKEALKDYDVEAVDLKEGKKPISDDIDLLVVMGPSQPLAERAKYELDQFLMKGKSMIVLLDGMTLETPRGQFQPDRPPPRIARGNNTGLRPMLEYYGAKLNDDLVMDRQNTRVILPVGGGRRIITNYPAFPIVTDLSKESPITRDVRAFIPIFPSSVELTKEVQDGKAGVTGEVLARSSQKSWQQKGFFLFDPTRQPNPTKDLGPFGLAVSLKGTFKSYFAGKKVPEPGPPAPLQEKAAAKPTGDGQKSPKDARLLVMADSDFVKDQYLGLNPSNLMLLLNMVDYMVQDTALIAIRGKSQTRRPLETQDDGTLAMAKYGNIVGLPVLFIVMGLARWRWRRAVQKRNAENLRQELPKA